MLVDKSLFKSQVTRGAAVSNAAYQILVETEKFRDQYPDNFAQRRFDTLIKLLHSKQKISQDDVDQRLSRNDTKLDLHTEYQELRTRLLEEPEREVLDQIYEGASLEEIEKELDINFEDLLFHLRKIELFARNNGTEYQAIPTTKIKAENFARLAPRERKLISLFSIGYTDAIELARLTGKKRNTIDGDLATAWAKLGINAKIHRRQARELAVTNIEDKEKLIYSRLLDFLEDPKLQQRILDHHQGDIVKTGKFVTQFNTDLSERQRHVLKMQLWHKTLPEILAQLKKLKIPANDDTVYRDLRQSRKILKEKIEEYLNNHSAIPDEVDPLLYTKLTPQQKDDLDHYLSGMSVEAMTEMTMRKRSKDAVHKMLARIAKTLDISRADLDKMRVQQGTGDLETARRLWQLFTPNEKFSIDRAKNNLTIYRRLLDTLIQLKKENPHQYPDARLFIDRYLNNLDNGAIARKNSRNVSHIDRDIERTTLLIADVIQRPLRDKPDARIDDARWWLIRDEEKLILIAHYEGLSNPKIIARLGLSHDKSTVNSKIKTTKKALGLSV